MKIFIFLLCSAVVFQLTEGSFRFRKTHSLPVTGDVGEPLFLTPLIKTNNITGARTEAEVHYSGFHNVSSYSGYLTVDESFNSNLFFWFFPSQNDFEKDPVLLWLQGGPGAPSMYGLFMEHGPLIIQADDTIILREYSWTRNHSVLYIDNPVGTGYSFTESGGYAQNQTKVGEDLYSALVQFFTLFPELQDNDFAITGESYGGKYVPALGHTIYKNNPNASLKINLQALAIGNGLSDPTNQADYGDYLYQLGLVDLKTRELLRTYRDKVKEFIEVGDYDSATEYFNAIMIDAIDGATSLPSIYNYIQIQSDPVEYWEDFVQKNLRKPLHIGSTPFNTGPVFENLWDDISKSVAPWIAELLDNYRVLLYSGQLDVIVAFPLTENYIQNLNFSGAEEYKTASKYIWRDDEGVAGYFKQAGNLTEVLVRNAGHAVPITHPKRAYDLIYKFIRNLPFNV